MLMLSSGIVGLTGLFRLSITVIFESLGKVARFTNIHSITGRVTASDDINPCVVTDVIMLDPTADRVSAGVNYIYPSFRV